MSKPADRTVKLTMLAHYEFDYDDVEHFWALPTDKRKQLLLDLIRQHKPVNNEVHEFQLNDLETAIAKTYWEITKEKFCVTAQEEAAFEAAMRNNAILALP